jgi:hypothetical protein
MVYMFIWQSALQTDPKRPTSEIYSTDPGNQTDQAWGFADCAEDFCGFITPAAEIDSSR